MNETIINRLINLLHKTLDHFAKKHHSDKGRFLAKIKHTYGFEDEFGWNMLLNAIYVLQDTELAKSSFLKFGIQGPCKHEDIGEKYLRLYGFLNALYLQKIAIGNLLEIFKIRDKKSIVKRLNASQMIELRNKAASHSSNYGQGYNTKKDLYEIHRRDLENEMVTLCLNQSVFEKYDISDETDYFNQVVTDALFNITKKAIKKIFNNKGSFYEELKCIAEERNGIIHIKSKGKTIVKLSPAARLDRKD